MPYIIETGRGDCTCTEADDPNDHRKDCPQWGAPEPTRTAVATLEEARLTAYGRIISSEPQAEWWDDHRMAAHSLPESGGTIGPLPDGIVIEVRRVDWMDFERLVRRADPLAAPLPEIETFDSDYYRAGLLAAFNAA